MRATVPIECRSAAPGSSSSALRWVTTPITWSSRTASLIRAMVFWRPTASGNTPPGKKTLLRKGRMGRTCGISSLLMRPGAAGVTTFPFSDIARSLRGWAKSFSVFNGGRPM